MLGKIHLRTVLLAIAALAVLAATWGAAAAQAASTTTSVEGEKMTLSGPTIVSSSAASGGAYIAFWSNGSASQLITTPGAMTGLVVRARGDQCGGAPQMAVEVDGRRVGTSSVSSTAWSDVGFSVNAAAGTHSVKVAFTNDYLTRACDRNLRVDRISVASSTASSPAPAPAPAFSAAIGEYSGSSFPSSLDSYTSVAGRAPRIAMWFQSWNEPLYYSSQMSGLGSRGVTPMITWAQDTGLSSRDVTAGRYDSYIAEQARLAKSYGSLMYIRLFHEMNGTWMSYGPVNGQTGADFVAAWRHVVGIFRQQGVSNVRWVWSPNIYGSGPSTVDFTTWYPGDDWVDVAGLDAYNDAVATPWRSFLTLTKSSYDRLAAVSGKPLAICEWGSTEQGGDKAAWIRQAMLVDIPQQMPRVKLITTFNINKERDWRVNSSASSLAAYRDVTGSPLYHGILP